MTARSRPRLRSCGGASLLAASTRDGLPTSRSGEPVVEVSQANPGLVARDLAAATRRRRAWLSCRPRSCSAICRRAAVAFAPRSCRWATSRRPRTTTCEQLSATTGMPQALGRRNMEKIRFVLDGMEAVLAGLTRGLDLSRPRRRLRPAGLGSGCRFAARPTPSGWCCRATRPACTRSGCRRSRSRCRWRSSPGGRSRGRRYRIVPGLPRRRRARRRRSASIPATTRWRPRSCCAAGARCSSATRPRWRRGGAIRGSQVHGPGWSKVVFGADARRGLAPAPRPAGGVDRRERRPLVRQRLGRLDARRTAARWPRRSPSGWRRSRRVPLDDPEAGWSPSRRAPRRSGSRPRSTGSSRAVVPRT